VLYNGEKEYEDRGVLKLSDAFREADLPVLLELTVNIYNINNGRNAEILKKSRALGDYAAFVAKVREFRASGGKDGNALAETVKYCIKNDIMKEFLVAHGSEVVNMLLTEFNMDDAKKVWQEEAKEDGIEEGIEKGIKKGIEKTAKVALAKGFSVDDVSEITGLDLNTIEKLKAGTMQ
jgi:predicted transposase/invertase (TIGR01784 family)